MKEDSAPQDPTARHHRQWNSRPFGPALDRLAAPGTDEGGRPHTGGDPMLDRVVTGGQTGADQAGWRVARTAGIPTGGWMTRGFLTETPDGRGDEPHPEFAELYGARGLPTDRYADR